MGWCPLRQVRCFRPMPAVSGYHLGREKRSMGQSGGLDRQLRHYARPLRACQTSSFRIGGRSTPPFHLHKAVSGAEPRWCSGSLCSSYVGAGFSVQSVTPGEPCRPGFGHFRESRQNGCRRGLHLVANECPGGSRATCVDPAPDPADALGQTLAWLAARSTGPAAPAYPTHQSPMFHSPPAKVGLPVKLWSFGFTSHTSLRK